MHLKYLNDWGITRQTKCNFFSWPWNDLDMTLRWPLYEITHICLIWPWKSIHLIKPCSEHETSWQSDKRFRFYGRLKFFVDWLSRPCIFNGQNLAFWNVPVAKKIIGKIKVLRYFLISASKRCQIPPEVDL